VVLVFGIFLANADQLPFDWFKRRFLYADFYKDRRPFEPKLLTGVSTKDDEYLPMFSPDNELLFFTRSSRRQAKGDFVSVQVEELVESRRADTKQDFGAGAALPEPFNQGDNYGGVTVSLNNKEVFVVIGKPTEFKNPDGSVYKNMDIYRVHYDTHMDFATARQTFTWSPSSRARSSRRG